LSQSPVRHAVLIPENTYKGSAKYYDELLSGTAQAGARLAQRLQRIGIEHLSISQFIGELLDSKVPQIFAESEVAGDGSDWNLTELSILGDISIAVPVTIFDNGNHRKPIIHEPPFLGTLVFTPGALLDHGSGGMPADWNEATAPDGKISPEGYYGLYRRRLLPVFQHINEQAAKPKSAFVTIPGLGCGQFAGPFRGTLRRQLQSALERFLEEFGAGFPNIKAVYFDPYDECVNFRREIQGISFLVRPLTAAGNQSKSQLCRPVEFEEKGDNFSDCSLFSIVAWDHVSWPGNDYYAGARSTDDGVKAAATDAMYSLTGIQGAYDASMGKYLPPAPFGKWEQVAKEGMLLRGLRLWNAKTVHVHGTVGDTAK
jgi:hypothetical protein